ncbi:alpha/beta fold hydrolase [Thalassotalea maritima]|uniref:alpha/beta fold hydrolase n=1 Tax=Thalassotalea maritima TaxID=3242416 RepID=UPI0035288C22
MPQQSLYIDVDNGHQLHIRHIYSEHANDQTNVPILMVHGAIENGRIFYSTSGKGLGPYLAENGFDVYVMDMRGRGLSTPKINAESDFGQYETINIDLPACIDFVWQRCGQPMQLISHSWGGVLLASLLARYPSYLDQVRSNICFGTKRSITRQTLEKVLKVDIMWNRLLPFVAKQVGYFDAKKWRVGADSETRQSLAHSVAWVKRAPWIDPRDGFDYGHAAGLLNWPPTWHLTGVNDSLLGHAQDVKHFIEESNNLTAKFSLLGTTHGNLVDYDHNDILTHPKARADHFPQLVTWLKQH